MPAFLLCAAALAAAQTLAFDQALDLSVQRSEAARAARAAAHGATESSRAAAQLPDPMLRAGIDNQPTSGGREPMTMKRIGLSQEWVPADKRAARVAVAEAMGQREATQSRIAEADARLRAALAYVDAWYADAELQLALQLEARFQEESQTARARLAGGAGDGAAVLGLATELGMAEDEREQARQRQAGAFIALQRWVGLRPDALAPLPALALPTEDDFVAGSPAVLAARRELDLARRGAELAAKELHPNWTWEVAYGQRTGNPDLVSVGVSIPLPVARAQRQDRETAARLAQADRMEAELAEATRAAAADYQALASDAQRLQQRSERYEQAVLVPARQRSAAALAAYRSSQGSLAAVFEARRAELQQQRRLLALQRELAVARARLAFQSLAHGDAR